jgi:hypothetical protein
MLELLASAVCRQQFHPIRLSSVCTFPLSRFKEHIVHLAIFARSIFESNYVDQLNLVDDKNDNNQMEGHKIHRFLMFWHCKLSRFSMQ